MPTEMKSKKDTFRERFGKRYPDVDLENEDAYYDSANSLMDEYERYEASTNRMRDRIAKSPMFAEMLNAAAEQDDFDPVVWMVQNKGLDLQALSEDAEYAQKLADAHNNYLERLAKQDEIEQAMAVNMPASVEAIRSKIAEMGISDEQGEQVIGKMYQIMDDLIVGKIDPAMFELIAKGENFDVAVSDARAEGVADGLNTKVTDKLRDISATRERVGGRQSAVQPRKIKEEPINYFE